MKEEVLAETVCPHCNHPIDVRLVLADARRYFLLRAI